MTAIAGRRRLKQSKLDAIMATVFMSLSKFINNVLASHEFRRSDFVNHPNAVNAGMSCRSDMRERDLGMRNGPTTIAAK